VLLRGASLAGEHLDLLPAIGTDNDWAVAETWDSGWVGMPDTANGENCTTIVYANGTLDTSASYYWRICFKDTAGTPGDWSTTQEFSTAASLETYLSWDNSARAAGYYIHFGTATNPPYNTSTTALTWDPGTLDYDQSYYWKVIAYNVSGNSTTTEWWFRTVGPPSTISGSCPTNCEVTVYINGAPVGTDTDTSGGTYFIACALTTGDLLHAIITTSAGAEKGAVIGRSPDGSDINDFNLGAGDEIIIYNDTIDNTEIDDAQHANDPYSFSGVNITTESNVGITVLAGAVYAPGADVTIEGELSGLGTFNLGTNKLTLKKAGDPVSGFVGTYTVSSGTVDYAGIAAQTVKATTYGSLIISGSNTKTAVGAVLVNGAFTLSGGTFDLATHNIQVDGAWNDSGGTFAPTSETVTLGGGAQNVTCGASNKFYNLTCGGSGTKTAQSDVTIECDLSGMQGFSLGTNTLTLKKAGDPVSLFGGYDVSSGTVDFAGTVGQTVKATTYGSLIISGSNTKTAAGTFTINDTLTVSAGTFNAGSGTITLKSIVNNATFNTASGTMLFIGNGSISGSNDVTFYKLTVGDGDYDHTNSSVNVTVSGNCTIDNACTFYMAKDKVLTIGGSATFKVHGASFSGFAGCDYGNGCRVDILDGATVDFDHANFCNLGNEGMTIAKTAATTSFTNFTFVTFRNNHVKAGEPYLYLKITGAGWGGTEAVPGVDWGSGIAFYCEGATGGVHPWGNSGGFTEDNQWIGLISHVENDNYLWGQTSEFDYGSTNSGFNWGSNGAPFAPDPIYCEDEINPTNVLDATPEFRAPFSDPDPASKGEYCEIEVGASPGAGDMWISGKTLLSPLVEQNENCGAIEYAGDVLAEDATYYWRVRFWDDTDNPGAWSSENKFSTGDLYADYAAGPDPDNEAQGIPIDYVLGWSAVGDADNYNVYIGDSMAHHVLLARGLREERQHARRRALVFPHVERLVGADVLDRRARRAARPHRRVDRFAHARLGRFQRRRLPGRRENVYPGK
jgi:hypothetical protein